MTDVKPATDALADALPQQQEETTQVDNWLDIPRRVAFQMDTVQETWRSASDLNPKERVSWRDQMKDPYYQFVQLVAGYSNVAVSQLVFDDSHAMTHLQQLHDIETYQGWLVKLGKIKDKQASPAMCNLRVIVDTNCTPRPPVITDRKTLTKWINDNPQRNVYVTNNATTARDVREIIARQRRVRQACLTDMETVQKLIYSVERRPSANPITQDISGCHATTPHTHQLYHSADVILRPMMLAAKAMTDQKITTRCHIAAKTTQDLYQRPQTRALYAYIVSRQYLISLANNARGTYRKVVDYRRFVRQENSAISTLKRLVGGARSGSIGGYDAFDVDLFT